MSGAVWGEGRGEGLRSGGEELARKEGKEGFWMRAVTSVVEVPCRVSCPCSAASAPFCRLVTLAIFL